MGANSGIECLVEEEEEEATGHKWSAGVVASGGVYPIWANIRHAIIEFTIIPLIAMQLASLLFTPWGWFLVLRSLTLHPPAMK